MPLRSKPLLDISLQDIKNLIHERVEEGRTIDYKAALPRSDSEKKKFLGHVASFANADGGDLVFGVKEEQGVPIGLAPIEDSNPDEQKLRLEHVVSNGIAPRLVPIIETRSIGIDAGFLLLVRVRRSARGPHMVTFQTKSPFFMRDSSGRREMDVFQIRNAFLASEALGEKMTRFRDTRIRMITTAGSQLSQDPAASSQFTAFPAAVLHIIPFRAFELGSRIDARRISDVAHHAPLPRHSGGETRFNVDGYFRWHRWSPIEIGAHLQLFRNGIIEAGWVIGSENALREPEFSIRLRQDVIQYLRYLRELGADPPAVVHLTFLHVKGLVIKTQNLSVGPHFPDEVEAMSVDRDHLRFPEVIVENFSDDPASILRPVLDAVWNAAGHRRCLCYDEDGEWRHQ